MTIHHMTIHNMTCHNMPPTIMLSMTRAAGWKVSPCSGLVPAPSCDLLLSSSSSSRSTVMQLDPVSPSILNSGSERIINNLAKRFLN